MFLLQVLIGFLRFESVPCQVFHVFSTTGERVYTENATPKALATRSLVDCSVKCTMFPGCLSHSYDKHQMKCHFHDSSDVSSNKINKSLLSGKLLSFRKTSRCHTADGNRVCEEIPQNAKEVAENRNEVSPPELDICKTHFRSCDHFKTSGIKASRNSMNAKSACVQYKWTNPKTKERHYIPCNAYGRFKVNVLGTPTEKSRFSFNLFDGADKYVLHVDCRIAYKDTKKVVVGNNVGHKWKTDMPQNEFPFKVGKQFNVTISVDGDYYVVNYDGEEARYTFSGRPLYLEMRDQVEVYQVMFMSGEIIPRWNQSMIWASNCKGGILEGELSRGKDAEWTMVYGLSREKGYSCKTDFLLCNHGNTSGAKFESLLDCPCVQYKWTNPPTENRHFVPCKAKNRFNVNILGMPTKNERFNINLMNGVGEYVLHFDCRFAHQGSSEIVIGNNIGNNWKIEQHLKEFPFNVWKQFNVTISVNGDRCVINYDGYVARHIFRDTPVYLQMRDAVEISEITFEI